MIRKVEIMTELFDSDSAIGQVSVPTKFEKWVNAKLVEIDKTSDPDLDPEVTWLQSGVGSKTRLTVIVSWWVETSDSES